MKSQNSPQNQFESACKHYYDVLKKGFQDSVAEATNKEYAIQHFKIAYFEQNDYIPYTTVYFQELKKTFDHFIRLDEKKVIEKTLYYLPVILEISLEAYNQGKEIALKEGKIKTKGLPTLYRKILNDETNIYSLDAILALEKLAINTTTENTIALLAIYHTTQTLLDEIDQFSPICTTTHPPSSTNTKQPTRSQQVLIAHYLFIILGMEARVNIDVTVCAEIVHFISRTPYTTIANSEIYKKFLNPLGNSSAKQTVKDLQIVRKQLEKLVNEKFLSTIDKDIADLKQK